MALYEIRKGDLMFRSYFGIYKYQVGFEVLTAVSLKMVVFWVVRTSETLVNFYQTIRRYNPEDSHLRTNINIIWNFGALLKNVYIHLLESELIVNLFTRLHLLLIIFVLAQTIYFLIFSNWPLNVSTISLRQKYLIRAILGLECLDRFITGSDE
jgi:hypothetical protein